jgi:nitroreductase
MELLELMKTRHSIRRYQDRQVPEPELRTILEAGLYAPNAGGGQRSMVVALRGRELSDRVGRWNAACMDRTHLAGSYVSAEQPSLIDDPTIRSGFYGAPTVVAVFGQQDFLYRVPDSFCAAENMVLMAENLGISSCIVARGEETFANPEGEKLLRRWGVPENYLCSVFVLLGYREGPAPKPKQRRPGRALVAEGMETAAPMEM